MQWELDALRDAGIDYAVDGKALARRELRLTFKHTVGNVDVKGEALFPDLYPDFRPAVNADPLDLVHHQNPFTGNLCVLGRSGEFWQAGYSLAWLLMNQLPGVLASGRENPDPDAIALEDPQAEPYSAYIPCVDGTGLLVDGSWTIPLDHKWGRLILGTREPRLDGTMLRGAVLAVLDPDRNVLAEADPRLAEVFPHKHLGRWVRSQLKNKRNGHQLRREALDGIPGRARTTWPWVPSTTGRVRVLGVLIPEEVAQRKDGHGWFFISDIEKRPTKKQRRAKTKPEGQFQFVRTIYAGPKDLSLRVPELEPMLEKTIALFGLGTLGAPAALEFGRCAVKELRILDHDFVDGGPIVRWPFGLKEAGKKKVDVVKAFLAEHYPYTTVREHDHRLGDPPLSGRKSDVRVLDEMLNGADLVFDATANLDVQRFLSRVARERGIPYLSVVGRHGAWGGLIFRDRPGHQRGCWHCLQHALQPEGSIGDAPSADPTGVQPRGCGDVTFTGASFDMATIALDAVRRAVATLCEGEGGYPDSDWDVAVITLRNKDGTACTPEWALHTLPPRPDCECSGEKQ